MRLDFYIGERDLFGVGFSDNVIFRKQYYAARRLTTRYRRRIWLSSCHTVKTSPMPTYMSPMERLKPVGSSRSEARASQGGSGSSLNWVPEVGWPTPL